MMQQLARSSRLALASCTVVFLGGCAWFTPRDGDFPAGVPLPYNVGVVFDEQGSSFPEATETTAPRFLKSPGQVTEAVARTLVDYPVVSRAAVLPAASRTEALRSARDGGYDFLIYVSLQAPATYEAPDRPWPMATLEVVSWLFGGIPSWFVPTLEYRTDTELEINVVDLNDRKFHDRGAAADVRPNVDRLSVSAATSGVSLWDRSDILEHPGDYALSIIMPPMFIEAEDAAQTSQVISERVLEDLRERFAESVRSLFQRLERESPLRVVVRSPLPGAYLSGERPGLLLEVVSRGDSPVRRLDVQLVGGRPFRWQPDADQLRQLNERLASPGGAGRGLVRCPVRLPFVQGENIVRLRVLLENGERLTRTVVYRYGEE